MKKGHVIVRKHHRHGGHVKGYKVHGKYIKPTYRKPHHVSGYLRRK